MSNAVQKIEQQENDNRPLALSPMEMVGKALEMGVSPEILKQMMDLRDREEERKAKLAFTKAVALAKSELRPILKTREVDYQPEGKKRVNYRHEDLAGIEEQVLPILTKHGLSYRFESDNGPDRPLTITCVLEHEDGHSTRTPLSAGADNSGGKNSLQAIASAATYLSRYTLKLALGLSVSHDDDGAKADETVVDRITEDQEIELRELNESRGASERQLLSFLRIDRLSDLPSARYGEVLRTIKTFRKDR